MKKRLVAVILIALVVAFSLTLTAFAETTPADVSPTEAVIATEATVYTNAPIETSVVTDPIPTEEPGSSVPVDTNSTDTTESASSEATGSTETTVAESTAIVTNPPEPTEPDEDSTFSDYVSPDPVYTPADQDFEENDWQEIKLDLNAKPASGKSDFLFIQENNSKGNNDITFVLIIGIVLIFLAIAGVTFVIIYNPDKKEKAVAKTANAPVRSTANVPRKNSRTRSHTENRRTYNPDDYNDGF